MEELEKAGHGINRESKAWKKQGKQGMEELEKEGYGRNRESRAWKR
jgi:hypothetical protein